MALVEVAFKPVIRGIMAVRRNSVLSQAFFPVEFGTLPQDLGDTLYLWTVRIVWCLAFGVVFSVYGDPLTRHHAGGKPQPETEEVAYCRVQVQRPVRLVAVQKQRHTDDSDMCQDKTNQQITPPGNRKQPGIP